MEVRKVKVCLVGRPAVGKTSLIRRFVLNKYEDNYLSTLGTKVSKKTINFPNHKLILMVWDLTGQVEFKKVRSTAYLNADGGIIVGDLSRSDTIKELPTWQQELQEVAGNVPTVILGNKSDLLQNKQEASETMYKLSKHMNSPFLLTSAKTGENVEEAFQELGKLIYQAFGRKMNRPQMIPRVGPDRVTPLTVEDEIIMKFCEMMGDNDVAMATVRKQFVEAKVDFRKPSKEELRIISKRLANILQTFRGPEAAKTAKTDFSRMINKLDGLDSKV